MKQIVLNAQQCSGRGVRLKVLGLGARAAITEAAAKELGPEGTMMQLRQREAVDGVCAMVVGVTEKTGFKTKADLVAAGDAAGWKKVTFAELVDDSAKYFGAKDMAALANVFRKLHDVTEQEVDDILGEALDVTED